MAKAVWVTDILPGLSAEDLANVLHQLNELGVEEESDLCMVEEQDLLGILKAIQARKVIASWKKQTVKNVNDEPESETVRSGSKISDSSHVVNSVHSPIPLNLSPRSSAWVQTFKIPWKEMPENLIAVCKSKKRPKPSVRREMVRQIIQAVCQVTKTPGKKNLDKIAETVVNKYPASFRDQIDDRVIGNGYASLAKQLLNRFENVHRQPMDSLRKRIYEVSSGSGEDDSPGSGRSDRFDRTDSYGCINWQPCKFPSNESVETQQSHKLWLQEEYRKVVWDKEEVSKKMQLTYTSQRLTINEGKFSIAEMIEGWPFLSEEDCILNHFKELVGIDLKEEILKSVTSKTPKIFRFLKSQSKFMQVVKEVEERCDVLCNKTPVSYSVLHFIAAFMDEEADDLVMTFEEGTDLSRLHGLPKTPFLAAFGRSLSEAERFHLYIDGEVVCRKLHSFFGALSTMFASFYIFNIHYPESCSCTMEFFQRFFIQINPDVGSKVKKQKGKKNPSLNTKVLNFATLLMNFGSEWSL